MQDLSYAETCTFTAKQLHTLNYGKLLILQQFSFCPPAGPAPYSPFLVGTRFPMGSYFPLTITLQMFSMSYLFLAAQSMKLL